jgi:glycosyltransferase involved in cell wall biosynthesis
MPATSVIVCVRNADKYIGKCIKSILYQTFQDFELVIINDCSNDGTKKIVSGFNDKRIRYFENEKHLGIARSRNRGLQESRGKYIFFTDGDAIVSENWVEEGLRCFEKLNCVGVEGKIWYVSENYKHTFSDRFCESQYGGDYMTGNIAYRLDIVKKIGGFDEKYSYHEDRDLGLRIRKYGKICFNPRMIVYGQQQTLTPTELIKRAKTIENRVYLYKKFGERAPGFFKMVYPNNLAKILFPPLIMITLIFHRFETSDDFKLLPFTYISALFERLQLWKTCAQERVFLI